jgi:hypothetical protein
MKPKHEARSTSTQRARRMSVYEEVVVLFRHDTSTSDTWDGSRTTTSSVNVYDDLFRHDTNTSVSPECRRHPWVDRGQPLTDPSPGTIPHICSPFPTLVASFPPPFKIAQAPLLCFPRRPRVRDIKTWGTKGSYPECFFCKHKYRGSVVTVECHIQWSYVSSNRVQSPVVSTNKV